MKKYCQELSPSKLDKDLSGRLDRKRGNREPLPSFDIVSIKSTRETADASPGLSVLIAISPGGIRQEFYMP